MVSLRAGEFHGWNKIRLVDGGRRVHTLQSSPVRAILREMRALVLLGLLTTAACGLDEGGLAANPSDADSIDGTPDESTSDGGAAPPGSPKLQDSAPNPDASAVATPDDKVAALPEAGPDTTAVERDAGSATGGDAAVAPPPTQGDGGQISSDDSGGISVADASPGDGAACLQSIPVGWNLSLFPTASNACPSGSVEHDVSGAPTVGATACSCACTVTQDCDCLQGTVSVSGDVDGGATCDTPIFTIDVSGPGCAPFPVGSGVLSLPPLVQLSALAPQGGTCSGTSQVDMTQVSTPAARYCEVPRATPDLVCGGNVPSGFLSCIATSGVTPCPSASPFATRYVVEDAVTLQCAPCTECAVTGTCSNPIVSAYDDRLCRDTPIAVLQADGTCDSSGVAESSLGSGMGMGGMGMGGMGMGGMGMGGMGMGGMGHGGDATTILSVQYSAVATTTCAAGSSTATTELTNPVTICCQ